jgi:RNA polymerase sigma-70 factor, ECF subfamily
VEELDDPVDPPISDDLPRDTDAFTSIYRLHVHGIRAFAYRRCGDPHLADDITAVVFERAWRHFPTLRVPEYGVGPWLYRIAANELASHFRRRGRGDRAYQRLALVRAKDGLDPADRVELQHDIDVVRDALGRLRARHQEVIALRYLSGLTPQETADAMGITPPVVAAVLHRALKALEKAIRSNHPPDTAEGGD